MQAARLVWLLLVGPLAMMATGGAAGSDSPSRPGAADDREPAPLVVGHRGAAGYLPDHTLEAYALGAQLGADYIDVDLVVTRDGELVARHEPNIIATTNVASLPQFAARRRKATIDGQEQDGFFVSDFTLDELRQLRAVQPPADRDHAYGGAFGIATFDEIIALSRRMSEQLGQPIGLYVETKHPTYHRQIGLPLEDRLLTALRRHGLNQRNAPVIVQSFETANLRYLRERTPLRLVQLVDGSDVDPDGRILYAPPELRPYDWTVAGRGGTYADLLTPEGLADVRTYADGVGPWLPYLISTRCIAVRGSQCADANNDGRVDAGDRVTLPPTDLVARAHAAGLLVHPFTFRSDPSRLPSDYAGNPINQYFAVHALGVDGVFSDFPDTANTARALWKLRPVQ